MRNHLNLNILLTVLLIFVTALGAAAAGPPLTFGLPPFANPAVLQENFVPLADYLGRAVDRPVQIVFSPNYISHVLSLGRGEIDIAYVGPSPYVKAKDKFGGIELLAQLRQKGDDNNRMVIFTRAGSGIAGLGDLQDKIFAFGDYQSFGSHFLPRFLLNQHGIPLKCLAAYDYVGSHDNVILGVLHGDFDAGGVRFDIFSKYAERGLRVIHGPVSLPPHVIICRSGLPVAVKEKLKKALLNLADPRVYKKINPAMTGFAPVADRDFSLARRVIDAMESK